MKINLEPNQWVAKLFGVAAKIGENHRSPADRKEMDPLLAEILRLDEALLCQAKKTIKTESGLKQPETLMKYQEIMDLAG